MNTRKYVILATKAHPLYEKLKASGYSFYDLEEDDPFEGKEARYREAELVFDFTMIDRHRKERLLKVLTVEFKAPVVSDLTCLWGEYFIERYPNLKGAIACAFWSPTNTREVFTADGDEKVMAGINELFESLGLTSKKAASPGHGFIFPRTVAMLINEATMALEDKLASQEDLDTAMKFGVNYPLGLLEWKDKIGAKPLLMLLDDLYHVTGDSRYRASVSLRKEANPV
jgi:3-hydroxybutyryl-CoA dehydrogenase